MAQPPPSQDSGPTTLSDVSPARPRRHRWRAFGTGLARAVLGLLAMIGFFLSVLPAGRAATRAAILLPSLVDASQFQGLTAGGDPIRHTALTLTANTDGSPIYLDVYEPIAGPPPIPGTRMAVLQIAGVGDNRQDAQFVNLSESFARSGIVVMNLLTPTLINYALRPEDAGAVVQAFQRLARWPGVDPHHVGLIGFSAGGALDCLAASQPSIRDQVAFIVLFGSYYNVRDFIGDMGRRAQTVNGQPEPWIPAPLSASGPALQSVPLQVLANSVAPLLPSSDGMLVADAFRDGTPLDAATVAALAPPSQAIYHLLAGDTPTETDANLAQLSPPILDLLGRLSPSAVVGDLHTTIYLLHDRFDHYVPFTESLHFNQAYMGPHDYIAFTIFQHVEVKTDLGPGPLIGDGSRLYKILIEVLGNAG